MINRLLIKDGHLTSWNRTASAVRSIAGECVLTLEPTVHTDIADGVGSEFNRHSNTSLQNQTLGVVLEGFGFQPRRPAEPTGLADLDDGYFLFRQHELGVPRKLLAGTR
jgi:hypothetical protein